MVTLVDTTFSLEREGDPKQQQARSALRLLHTCHFLGGIQNPRVLHGVPAVPGLDAANPVDLLVDYFAILPHAASRALRPVVG